MWVDYSREGVLVHHAPVWLPLVVALESALGQQPLAGVAACGKTGQININGRVTGAKHRHYKHLMGVLIPIRAM